MDHNINFNNKIIVAVRKRPLTKKEINRAESDVIKVNSHEQLAVIEHKLIKKNKGGLN